MKMKRKQKRWLALGMAALLVTGQADFSLAAALKNQMVQSGEGEIVGLVPAESELVQDNASYHASVDLNAGGAFSIKMPDKSNDWNTLAADMVPGTTMLSGQTAAISTNNKLSARAGDSVSGGIEIDGDISGYKSYFMFDEEIMFLGAGLTNESGLPGSELWTVVDTVPVKTAGSPRNKIALTGSQSAGIGYRWAEAWLDSSGVMLPVSAVGNAARKLLFASIPVNSSQAAGENCGYGYYFPDGFQTDRVRYQMTKTSDADVRDFSIWMPHDGEYQYLIVPNRPYGDFGAINANTYEQDTQVLENSSAVQAVWSSKSAAFAANFWSGGTVPCLGTGDVTSDQSAAVLIERDTAAKTMTIAVTPADNSGPLKVTVDAKASRVISSPAEVETDLTGGKITLTMDMAAVNKKTAVIRLDMDAAGNLAEPPVPESFLNSLYGFAVNVNPENGTGMTMPVRRGEEDYYGADYWETIQKNRLPGTITAADEAVEVKQTTNAPWNGGDTALGEYGLKGVRLSGGDMEGVQSYMMFQNQILCLGAGIENHSGSNSAVVLENIKLKSEAVSAVSMGYDLKPVSTWLGVKEWDTIYDSITNSKNETKGHSWFYVSNTADKKYGTGYYFPKDMLNSVRYRFAKRSSNGTDGKFFEFWLDLGANKSYDYVIFPEVETHAPVNAYFANPDNVIIANTSSVQAAYQKTDGVLAANFWTEAGGTVKSNYHSTLTVFQKASVLMQAKDGILSISVSDPEKSNTGVIELEIEKKGYQVTSADTGVEVDLLSDPNKIKIRVDVSSKTGGNFQVSVNTVPPAVNPDADVVTIICGESATLPKPDNFTGAITWKSVFLKTDGESTVNNSGYSKLKRELMPDEKDGTRSAGPASAEHIASCETLSNGNCLVTAKEFGIMYALGEDENGNKKAYKIQVRTVAPNSLPQSDSSDFAKLRDNWVESVIGSNLSSTQAGREALAQIEKGAETYWNSYAYKGQEACTGIPWPNDTDEAKAAAGLKPSGNPDTPYTEDAAEFRSAIQHVQAMAKAYAAEGSRYYHDSALLKDMTHIMDWITTNCYTAKSQTDNWWNWEIGVPKDLIQTLLFLYDGLTEEQVKAYTAPLVFFQPDPYHEGAAGTSSTHAQGYRTSQGANLIDCSIIALGIGALIEDGEYVYLANEATKNEFVIQQVDDSTLIPDNGYVSGFYPDGSYIDHSHVPYAGSYGIEYFKGGANIADILKDTPWQYGEETISNMESFVLNGFAPSMYNGRMLDMVRGRAVSRSTDTNLTAGRNLMTQMLKLMDAVTPEAQHEFKNYIKNWLLVDDGYLATLTKAEQLPLRTRAEAILADSSITGEIENYHKSLSYSDRAIHRGNDYLFGLSMYSDRIQNCEVTNSENRYGWHQGDGMTYLYNSDNAQYSDNFWNTVNPYRLPGTTVVPVKIGNGNPDGSGFYQEGDYRSSESFAGGSEIGSFGISGMSLSGNINAKSVSYAPDLRANKSWFMFEDEIVCLGSGIRNTGSLPVETVVENRKLNDAGTNKITADGRVLSLSAAQNQVNDIVNGNADTTGQNMEGITWLHLEGNEAGSDIGYYFPQGTSGLNIRKTANTGNYMDIGTTTGQAVKTYMEVWFDHGANPVDAAYEYVLLPGKSDTETKAYALYPKVEILANTPEIQAVRHRELGITGVNFFTDRVQSISGITSDKKASVMLEEDETNHTLTIAVSDPTMKNTESISLNILKPGLSVVSKDDNVEVELNGNTISLTVHTAGTNGTSSYAVIALGEQNKDLGDLLEQIKNDPSALEKPEVIEKMKDVLEDIQSMDNKQTAQDEVLLSQIWELEEHLKTALVNVGEIMIKTDEALTQIIGTNIKVRGAMLSVPLNSGEQKNIILEIHQTEQLREGTAPVKLNWDTSLTIDIQMHLQNAASQIIESKIQPLAPVQVTMQLPDDISASLPVYAGHINADNSIDWQKARVENNTMSFVVTSLSPFVIANIAENANDSQDSNQNSDDDDDDYGSGADRGKASGSVGTWMQNSTGWWYERADGSWPADTWEKINGIWYLFDKKGYMMTGWQKRGFYWYYMDSSGAMLEQAWTQSEGKWYWLGQDGIMSASAWVLYKNQWYYLKQNGEMAVSERVDQDRYQVDKNGVWTGQ